jgi:uncharacterized membrane protein YedE/YeeE
VAGIAIIVILFAVWVGKSAWAKPNSGARLAAVLGLIVGLWFVFAAGSPSGAGVLASEVARGIVMAAHSLGVFIRQF